MKMFKLVKRVTFYYDVNDHEQRSLVGENYM